jgi:hypothetical protein
MGHPDPTSAAMVVLILQIALGNRSRGS